MKRLSDSMWYRILPELEKKKFLLKKNTLKSVQLHDHAFLEFTYILNGSVKHIRDGQKNVLNAGDYLLVDFGSLHSYEAIKDQTFENLDCLFLPEFLDPILKGTSSLRKIFEHYLLHFNMQAFSHDPAHVIFHDDDGRVLSILKQMQTETERCEAGYKEMIRCCLIQILLITVRKIKDASVASTGHDISSFLTSYVAEHYMEPVTLCELADKMNYSLSYVSKQFKKDMGVSFVNYLQNYRVMQGCRLLSSTRRKITDIAENVGYHDVKFFASLVKRITGLSPTDFRRNQHL